MFAVKIPPKWPLYAGLSLLTLVVYWGTWKAQFVNFDDREYVQNNLRVQRGLTAENVLWAFTTMDQSNWHPLTWLSFMLDVQLGFSSGGHHAVNLLLHIVNTLLLFYILSRMTGAVWRSAAVAALFAVHPLHVESVAWICERKDVLSTLLGLLAIEAYRRYAERPGVARYLPVFGFMALSLMAKPMLVTLPCLLLLLDYWPLARWPQEVAWAPAAWRLLWEKLPLFALSAASSVAAYIAQQNGGAINSLQATPLGLRVENALLAYIQYVGKLFWPGELVFFYPYDYRPNLLLVAAAGVVLAASVAGAIWGARRGRRYLLVGLLWFLGSLVPTIGLVQVGNQALADRYTYIPFVGLFIVLVWGAVELAQRRRYGRPVCAVCAAAFLAALMIRSAIQVRYWHDSDALLGHALAVNPDNYVAHNNLGAVLWEREERAAAAAHWKETLRICPTCADAQQNLGCALRDEGHTAEALQCFAAAIAYRPNYAEAHCNLGVLLWQAGRRDEAISHWRAALKYCPTHANAANNLGCALKEQGALEEAQACFEAALHWQPEHADAHNNLGGLLWGQGKAKEAIAHWQAAIQYRPEFADAYNNLGVAYWRQQDLDAAVRQLSESIRWKPDFWGARVNLAMVFRAQGRFSAAVEQLQEALRENPGQKDVARELEQLRRQQH
jgi:tetratricopeptide (TPR) repeat protein